MGVYSYNGADMKKKSSFLLAATLLLSSSSALAQHTLTNGVLQAYWQNEWNKDATQLSPQLKLRYIVHNDGSAPTMVINVPVNKQDKQNRIFITKNFAPAPASFFQQKEGYLNQPGTLTVPTMTAATGCSSAYQATQLSSFTPDHSSGLSSTVTDEKFINCGERHPYLMLYTLRGDQQEVSLKVAPDEHAKPALTLNKEATVAKLKTVNKDWAYVAFYDAKTIDQLSDEKGYIKLNALSPLQSAPPRAVTKRPARKPCWYPRATHDKVMRDRHCRFSS